MSTSDDITADEAPSSHYYAGRRWFQAILGAIGLAIATLALYDLGQDREGPPQAQSQALENANRVIDEYIGQKPVDYIILVLGAWIVFFGLHGVLHRGPQLAIDDDGLLYFRFGRQTIPWDEIADIKFIGRRRTAIIRSAHIDLRFHEPGPIARRQPIPYRMLRRLTRGGDGMTFSIHGYDINRLTIEVLREIEAHLPEE